MKKITLFALLMVSGFGFSQSKSTGNISLPLATGITANITLDNTTSTVTLVLSGPNDRWFACKFGGFTTGMAQGNDGVYYNGSTLVDSYEGGFGAVSPDILGLNSDGVANQNWTIITNSLTGITRTITATRAFNTGDAKDYVFNYSNSTIAISQAHSKNASFLMNSSNDHGHPSVANPNQLFFREFGTAQFTTLSTVDFTLNTAVIYPNPSFGEFKVQSKTNLDQINIYSQTGQFVKSIDVADKSDKVEINVKGLSTGIYLIELKNATDKSWKKVVIE